MTRLTPQLTSFKTLNITYQTPQETLLDTPETLPTSEPATPQIGYTVQNSDLPVLSLNCYRKVWVALLFGAGKFSTSGTVYYRLKKNGVSIYSSNGSVSANLFYTVGAYFYNVNVGDSLELALWSSVSGSNWDYKAFQVQVSRLIILDKPRLMAPCIFAALSTQPVLTLGNPGSTSYSLTPTHDDRSLAQISTSVTYTFLYPKDNYGMFTINEGDVYSLPRLRTHSSYRPYHSRNWVPTQIKFRGAKLD